MSEPMPGALPAQQDADPPRAAGAAWPADQAESAGGKGPHSPEPFEAAEQHMDGEFADAAHADAAQADAAYADAAHADAAHAAAELADAAHADPKEPALPGEAEDEDDGPRPLGLHVEQTGHAPVDVQLRRLEDADHLAVSGHLEVYEDVHRGLREALAGLDRPAAPAPGQGHAPAPGHASAHRPGRPVPGPHHSRS